MRKGPWIRAAHRLIDIFRLFPVRLLRLIRHLLFLPAPPCLRDLPSPPIQRAGLWCLDALLYGLECAGLNELAETVMDLSKPGTRPLNASEKEVMREIFGTRIATSRVVIDTTSRLARRKKVAFVTFNTIHCWNAIPPNLLAHELTHIWQYQQFGAVYISKSLQAQHSAAGYNYGGEPVLTDSASFLEFNMEQQGDIVEDYFRHRTGLALQWIEHPSEHTLKKLKKITVDFFS